MLNSKNWVAGVGVWGHQHTHLGFELPGEEQVSVDLIQGVQSVHRLLHTGVQIHDASGDSVVRHL